MKASKNTNWLLLILLVFTGQTLAAPFANLNDCESDHSMPTHDMDSMPDHDMSMMDMSLDMESGMTMDCCEDDCQCSDGMCVSAVYLSINEKNEFGFIQNQVKFQESQFSYNQFYSSIYRPPIIS